MECCGVGRVDNWRIRTAHHFVHHRRRHNRDDGAQTGSKCSHHHHGGWGDNDGANNGHYNSGVNHHKAGHNNTGVDHHNATKPHHFGSPNRGLNQWPYNGLVPLAFQA